MKQELTPNEEYLIRLLNFKNLHELTEWLNAPENLETLAKVGPPDELYEELTRAEGESEMVDILEKLYRLSSNGS